VASATDDTRAIRIVVVLAMTHGSFSRVRCDRVSRIIIGTSTDFDTDYTAYTGLRCG
jgi:hypothetical protein